MFYAKDTVPFIHYIDKIVQRKRNLSLVNLATNI